MEPVTHLLTGACLARAGLHRRVAYATAAMAVAAEFPDIDTLWSVQGPISGFRHHRGITHTFLGVPVEAAFLLLCVFVWHRWRQRRPERSSLGRTPRSATRAPVRWLALYGCLLLALLSHLLLDFTNNYGIRPFFPFNPKWYAVSIVFIFDPLMFVLLLCGLLLPELFALVGQEIAGKRAAFRSPGWARAALAMVLVLWGVRTYEHGRALTLAGTQTLRAPAQVPDADSGNATEAAADIQTAAPDPVRPLLLPRRSLANPDPLSPFRWYTATDFGPMYLLGTADTRVEALAPGQVLNKAAPSAALSRASQTALGRAYLDWSAMPWITISSQPLPGQPQTIGAGTGVYFEDVRFMSSSPLLQRGALPPLTGLVVLGAHGEVVQSMDGRVEP